MTRRRLLYGSLLVLLLAACTTEPPRFDVVVMNGMTPVKNQGSSQLCWAYAMLAAIETEHIGRGDSVDLSPAYVEWMMRRHHPGHERGMGHTLINAIQQYGICTYSAYRSADDSTLIPPLRVFMGGLVYTPQEFARSVCAPGEYIALTSVAHAPYYKEVELPLPDNWEHNRFLHIPPDSLMHHLTTAVARHHGICWEGDTNEPLFKPDDGTADYTRLSPGQPTDNHCMAIVGMARRHTDGRLYFIMKNSWGERGPYGGLMYVDSAYVRHKTIAIYMTKQAYQND
ncbi:MAG: C1 family peptidase [Prevotella sp.]|nr:C1 family peptidase [Prevotella sp.]